MHQALMSQLKTGNLHHSYLYVGDESACLVEIQSLIEALGTKPADLIDYRSQEKITIADARAIRRVIQLAPHSSQYKLIVLPAARLFREATQALLKSIEEPPAHTIWLLYTHNDKILPQTIVSRCWRVYVGQYRVESEIMPLAEVTKLALSRQFDFANDLAQSGKGLQALDQWLVEVHTNGHTAQRINLMKQLLLLKHRLGTNTSVQLQLESFFVNLK